MRYHECLKTEVYKFHNVNFNDIPEVTIVFLTDLHNCEHGKNNIQLIEQIHRVNPDFIVCTGDMLVGKVNHSFQIPIDLFSQLTDNYSVYYSNGNHEARLYLYPEEYGSMYDDYIKQLEQINVHILNNDSVVLKEYGICLYGLDMMRCYYKRIRKTLMQQQYLNDTLGLPSEQYYNILLAHNPLYNPEYAIWGADLVLSGHVHGGLLRLPKIGGVISPQVRLFPKYSDGHYRYNDTDLIVSRGLGTHSFNIRLNNPPELSVIKLQGEL